MPSRSRRAPSRSATSSSTRASGLAPAAPSNAAQQAQLGASAGLPGFAVEGPRVAPQRGEIMADQGKGGGIQGSIRKFMTWFTWGIGGESDAEDHVPRMTGDQVNEDMLANLQPGDVILTGNSGDLSHSIMYLGDGEIIHSMATEKTMRGKVGRLEDLANKDKNERLEASGQKEVKTGVIREKVDEFFDRYERDTVVVMRKEGLTPEQIEAGKKRLAELVGAKYDYDFAPGNDTFYCNELAGEFYRAAVGVDHAPRIGARPQQVPGILDRDAVVDSKDILESPDLVPAWANDNALNSEALSGYHDYITAGMARTQDRAGGR